MKKTLLLFAALAVATAVQAQPSAPTIMPGLTITGISSNGKWAASSDDSEINFTIINLETGETWSYGAANDTEPWVSGGIGKFVSDNGIVIAQGIGENNFDVPYYWENGQWHTLPLASGDHGATVNAITPDGSRIAGSVGKYAMGLEDVTMNVPAVWDRKADGTYDMYKIVAYPPTDWTGRAPQYVLVDDISADGKVLAGDVVDCVGFVNEPIVIIEDEKGEWTYKRVHPELLNPNGVEFPVLPEEPVQPDPEDYMTAAEYQAYQAALSAYDTTPYPEPTDFMTEEELAAYHQAWEDFNADPDNAPYPSSFSYMTDEEIEQYNDACNSYWDREYPNPTSYMTEAQAAAYTEADIAYQEAYEAWYPSFESFMEAYSELVNGGEATNFEMNTAHISPNGKYYVMTGLVMVEDPMSWTGYSAECAPYLFNLETDEYCRLDKGENDVIATQVTDKGFVIGASPASNYVRNAYIAQGANEPFVEVFEMVEECDPELYAWMQENMVHEVATSEYIYNPTTEEYEEVVSVNDETITGTPLFNAAGDLMVSWTLNIWDFESEISTFSYALPIKASLGVNGIEKAEGVRLINMRGGQIGVIGNACEVTVYDINGRIVYTTNTPSSVISTGLRNGAYIIKATDAQGRVTTAKAVF